MFCFGRKRFEVAFFSNPLLALQSFKPHYYDLVILDIRMPEINGFELYWQLKKKDKHMKVCFPTASEMFYERYRKNKYNSLEKYLFLRKPISNEHLVEEITAFMAM